MDAPKCVECDAYFVWDADLGSGVCLVCGLMQDPNQVVLSSHIEREEDSRWLQQWDRQSSLKAMRIGGWTVADRGSDITALRRKNEIRQYISAITLRLGLSGLDSRTQTLFAQAMDKGNFRWGRKSRLVAGACLAVAIREGRKGVPMQDIAFLLNETQLALTRVFAAILILLEIRLPSTDPSWQLPVIHTYLTTKLAEQPCTLPSRLAKVLRPLNFPKILHTGNALSDLLLRAELVTHLPTTPTTCAIYILSIEGELMRSVPDCGQLATVLGTRFGIGKSTVLGRYRIIYKQVERWLSEIPWLRDTQDPVRRHGKVKVSKRVAIAQGLKDVVQFGEQQWKADIQAPAQGDSLSDDDEARHVYEDDTSRYCADRMERRQLDVTPCNRRKYGHLVSVSEFLLSPLKSASRTPGSRSTKGLPNLDVVTLTLSSPALPEKPPSRLQLLASTRCEEDIADEELFEEGELDGYLRGADEVASVSTLYTRDPGEGSSHSRDETPCSGGQQDQDQPTTPRVNMDAYRRLFTDDINAFTPRNRIDSDEDPFREDLEGPEEEKFPDPLDPRAQEEQDGADGAEDLGPWHPVSPLNCFRDIAAEAYDSDIDG